MNKVIPQSPPKNFYTMKKELTIISVAALGGIIIYFLELNKSIQNDPTQEMITAIAPSLNEKFQDSSEITPDKIPSHVSIQTYLFEPGENIVITGKEGTEISIERANLEFEDGTTPTGAIAIALKECYEVSDMIIEKLSTTNYNKMLETAGMVHIDASSEGKRLRIRKGKNFQIGFPRTSPKEDFQLFYGVKEKGKNIEWELAEAAVKIEPTPIEKTSNLSEQNCFILIRDSYVIRNTKIHLHDHFNWQLENGNSLQSWFVSSFNPTIEMIDAFCTFNYETQVHLRVDENGKIKERYLMKSSTPEYDLAILEQLDQMPRFDMKAFMPQYDEDHRIVLLISSGKSTSSDAVLAALEKKFDKPKSENAQEGITGISKSDLSYYVFNAAEMGWLNCDRFYDVEEKTDFLVQCDQPMECQVSLCFEKFQGLLAGTPTLEGVRFSGIPKGEKVKVITIQHGPQPLLSVEQADTKKTIFKVQTMKPFKLKDLRKEISS